MLVAFALVALVLGIIVFYVFLCWFYVLLILTSSVDADGRMQYLQSWGILTVLMSLLGCVLGVRQMWRARRRYPPWRLSEYLRKGFYSAVQLGITVATTGLAIRAIGEDLAVARDSIIAQNDQTVTVTVFLIGTGIALVMLAPAVVIKQFVLTVPKTALPDSDITRMRLRIHDLRRLLAHLVSRGGMQM